MAGPHASKLVFISYAHADNSGDDPRTRWLDRLLQHLKPRVRHDQIGVWSDPNIVPGDDWQASIRTRLDGACAAVLLVSPAFLSSNYIREHELPVLLQHAKEKGVRIIPVILRPCGFSNVKCKYPNPETGPEERWLA